jgi:hypothetical protein
VYMFNAFNCNELICLHTIHCKDLTCNNTQRRNFKSTRGKGEKVNCDFCDLT